MTAEIRCGHTVVSWELKTAFAALQLLLPVVS